MYRSVFLYDIIRFTLQPKYRETPLLHVSFSPETFQAYYRAKILDGDLRQIEKINLAQITLSSEFRKPVVVLLKKEKIINIYRKMIVQALKDKDVVENFSIEVCGPPKAEEVRKKLPDVLRHLQQGNILEKMVALLSLQSDPALVRRYLGRILRSFQHLVKGEKELYVVEKALWKEIARTLSLLPKKHLKRLLRSRSEEVRSFAVHALLLKGEPIQTLLPVLKKLSLSKKPNIRWFSCFNLYVALSQKNKTAMALLVSALNQERNMQNVVSIGDYIYPFLRDAKEIDFFLNKLYPIFNVQFQTEILTLIRIRQDEISIQTQEKVFSFLLDYKRWKGIPLYDGRRYTSFVHKIQRRRKARKKP